VDSQFDSDKMPEPVYSHPDTQAIANGLGFGIRTTSLRDLRDYFHLHRDEIAITGDIPEYLEAQCHVCQSLQKLEIQSHKGEVNWRETMRCPGCGLINRWRSSVHLFEALCKPVRFTSIYMTEAITPLFALFKKRYPKTVGSEYLEGQPPGTEIQVNGHAIRHEDVTRLSFSAGSYDAVLSFDVLEHVPDYRQALAEFFRVLKPGGKLLWSAPFTFEEQTEIRASLQPDGNIVHHLPPDYHGDPFTGQGVLCFQSFGFDILQVMEHIGFKLPRVCCFSNLAAGYLDRNILLIAQKPDTRSPLRRMLGNWFSR
jgi:SAM-dependent methyltransferase